MVELAPHYYRDNFQRLCDTVANHYGDLLDAAEQQFLQDFAARSHPAQCLYVRLVSRVGPWFREQRLDYPELPDIPALVDELLAAKMVLQADGLDLEEAGRLFTRPELAAAFPDLLRPSDSKAAQLEAIAGLALPPEEMLAALQCGRVITPAGSEVVAILQLLFFGNRHQSLTEFVLSDLGVARYFPYPLDREQRLFPAREALEEYLACAQLADAWYELREAGDASALLELAALVEVAVPASEAARRRWYRLCNGLGRDLERLGYPQQALGLYARSERHPARARSALVQERQGQWQAAATLCGRILDGPWCEEEREAAERIYGRVQRKLGGPPQSRRRDQFERLDLCLPKEDLSVELLVARALQSDSRSVFYVENQLFNALFGLAFWEQIFAPMPGAFNHPFQSVPADMYQPEFHQRRAQTLAARLACLRQAPLAELLPEAYAHYEGYQCRWVNWRRVSAKLVADASRVIPAAHLCAIWERQLFDPGENRRGFPDLLVLGETEGDYQLVEVKGPGDALQDSQKRWLRYFGQQSIPASVAWVQWADD